MLDIGLIKSQHSFHSLKFSTRKRELSSCTLYCNAKNAVENIEFESQNLIALKWNFSDVEIHFLCVLSCDIFIN